MATLRLSELAERLGCRLEGDGRVEIRRVTGLEQAGEGDLTFFANPKYAHALRRTLRGLLDDRGSNAEGPPLTGDIAVMLPNRTSPHLAGEGGDRAEERRSERNSVCRSS